MRNQSLKLWVVAAVALLMLTAQVTLNSTNLRYVSGANAGPLALAGTLLTPTPGSEPVDTHYPTTAVDPDGNVVTLPSGPPDSFVSSTPPQGIPAIEPLTTNIALGLAAFTDEAVRAYAQVYDTHGVGDFPSSVAPHIEKIEFVTEGTLQALIPNYNSGWPSDTLMCYVQYSGSFVQSAPPGLKIAPSTYPYAFEVFNAHTGNRLVHGTDTRLR